MKVSSWFLATLLGVVVLRPSYGEIAALPRVAPGVVMTLEFPELGEMQDKLPAACEVSIPKAYDAAKPVPLLVWFGGGKGSHQVAGAKGIVDFDRFVVVALPYPSGRLPRIAGQEGDVAKHWAFQEVMLRKVAELVPNIDPAVRVVAGTSSGAHLIGNGLSLEWPGFVDYFTLFVLHEGGYAASNKYPGAKDKRLLIIWGENSEVLKWQVLFNWRIGQPGARVSYHSVPEAGHGLDARGRGMIRAWIEERMTDATKS